MKTLTAFMISMVMANVSLAQTTKRLQVADFKTSSDCKQCHQQIHDQWMTSTHSRLIGILSTRRSCAAWMSKGRGS